MNHIPAVFLSFCINIDTHALLLQRHSSEPIEKLATELGVECPKEAEVVAARQHEGGPLNCAAFAVAASVGDARIGILLKYRADKVFKTWQSRICSIEGLALVYKGKADGKVRGVVSLKDCSVRRGPAEFEASFVIKSGTPFPTDLKDKKNRSFLPGRDYVRARRAISKEFERHRLTHLIRFSNLIPKMLKLEKTCATSGSGSLCSRKLYSPHLLLSPVPFVDLNRVFRRVLAPFGCR
jgi:hypothetical protein